MAKWHKEISAAGLTPETWEERIKGYGRRLGEALKSGLEAGWYTIAALEEEAWRG